MVPVDIVKIFRDVTNTILQFGVERPPRLVENMVEYVRDENLHMKKEWIGAVFIRNQEKWCFLLRSRRRIISYA